MISGFWIGTTTVGMNLRIPFHGCATALEAAHETNECGSSRGSVGRGDWPAPEGSVRTTNMVSRNEVVTAATTRRFGVLTGFRFKARGLRVLVDLSNRSSASWFATTTARARQIDNVKGSISGTVPDREGFGACQVNADCSAVARLQPGPGILIEERLVIVDEGREIRSATMLPPPVMVTGVSRKIDVH